MAILRLENVVQHYAWGSKTAIAELLGLPEDGGQTQAELWMGTHAKGPSMAIVDGNRILLQRLIERRPVDILGLDIVTRFGANLPFLFKVLAAARPLSIQAHPDKAQAAAGFSRENLAGKALDAPDRNYRDNNHKPEVICALTPFWALNGFRSASAAATLIAPVCPDLLQVAFQDLKKGKRAGIKTFFKAMMTLSEDKCLEATREIRVKAKPRVDQSPVYRWMVELARAYPVDMGVLAPALLNLVCLEPYQAMYLPAGQLHAYLDGVGVELMANSDNVLRGGLTPKHVDVPELLGVVRFVETPVNTLEAVPLGPAESGYDCPAEEFCLSRIRPDQGHPYRSASKRSVEILLCIAGNGIINVGAETTLDVKKGDSFVVPAGIASYTIRGHVTLFKAAVPLSSQ